jgi:hypothetical protein
MDANSILHRGHSIVAQSCQEPAISPLAPSVSTANFRSEIRCILGAAIGEIAQRHLTCPQLQLCRPDSPGRSHPRPNPGLPAPVSKLFPPAKPVSDARIDFPANKLGPNARISNQSAFTESFVRSRTHLISDVDKGCPLRRSYRARAFPSQTHLGDTIGVFYFRAAQIF